MFPYFMLNTNDMEIGIYPKNAGNTLQICEKKQRKNFKSKTRHQNWEKWKTNHF